jgi:hypothetical protein
MLPNFFKQLKFTSKVCAPVWKSVPWKLCLKIDVSQTESNKCFINPIYLENDNYIYREQQCISFIYSVTYLQTELHTHPFTGDFQQ